MMKLFHRVTIIEKCIWFGTSECMGKLPVKTKYTNGILFIFGFYKTLRSPSHKMSIFTNIIKRAWILVNIL